MANPVRSGFPMTPPRPHAPAADGSPSRDSMAVDGGIFDMSPVRDNPYGSPMARAFAASMERPPVAAVVAEAARAPDSPWGPNATRATPLRPTPPRGWGAHGGQAHGGGVRPISGGACRSLFGGAPGVRVLGPGDVSVRMRSAMSSILDGMSQDGMA
jgi:hypothetical protein